MYVEVLKSKIHNVVVTDAKLNYVGSITIDKDLMDASGLIAGEKVLVVNNNNGARLETYVIVGERATGIICLNGAAARLVAPGDEIIIIAFARVKHKKAHKLKPKVIFPYDRNLRWKNNDDICLELLSKGEDKVSVALKMGRTLEELEKLTEKMVKG